MDQLYIHTIDAIDTHRIEKKKILKFAKITC